ncbi:MAG: hypothetical protein S4CHLAM102_14690 [Chlamydiia bacterium]|nr:hypothetical protein [Chlamydiia bacterium]
MLKQLRKYQKFIFAIVATIVISSFTFFGTYNTLNRTARPVDLKVGVAIDGSAVYRSEIDLLMRMLETDQDDGGVLEGRAVPNYFNDGVIKRDILATGLGGMLFEQYRDQIGSEVALKYGQFKNFKPYKHPQMPIIGMEGLWGHVMPKFAEDYERFKGMDGTFDREYFNVLGDLFVDQTHFTPALARQFLAYQQQQFSSFVQPDPYLQGGDLALFYSRSFTDWFGRGALELVAQLIYNGAIYAEGQGYKVSMEEAKASLINNGMDAMRAQASQSGQEGVSVVEVEDHFLNMVRAFGSDEKQVVKAWQRVLLFRRMFDDVGTSVMLDPLMYDKYNAFASEELRVTMYTLPRELQLKSFDEMLKLEAYLECISKVRGHLLDLPSEYASSEAVLRKAPGLVARRYLVEVQKGSVDELASDLTLKSIWEWQVEGSHWTELCGAIPELAISKVVTEEERFKVLSALDPAVRAKADQIAVDAMVGAHPEWLVEKVKGKPFEQRMVRITHGGLVRGLDVEMSAGELMAQLEANDAIEGIMVHKGVLMNMRVLDRSEGDEVLTFAEAMELDACSPILEKKLELVADGNSEEGLDRAKERAFNRLITAIEGDSPRFKDQLRGLSGDEKRSFDVSHRFHRMMSEKLRTLKGGRELPEFGAEVVGEMETVAADGKLAPRVGYMDQWKWNKQERVVSRGDEGSLFDEEVFRMKAGEWSQVVASQGKGALFFHVDAKEMNLEAVKKEMAEGQRLLGLEARRNLMSQLLGECATYEAISLRVQAVEDE